MGWLFGYTAKLGLLRSKFIAAGLRSVEGVSFAGKELAALRYALVGAAWYKCLNMAFLGAVLSPADGGLAAPHSTNRSIRHIAKLVGVSKPIS